MTVTKFFKGRKQQKPISAPEPRQIDEITGEYGKLCQEAGQLQYQLHVYKQQLQQVNQKLMVINNEAAERQKLDKEKADSEKVEEV